MKWRANSSLPPEVRASLPLAPREKVLAAASDDGGKWVVASRAALFIDGERIDWADIVRAGWDPESSMLTIETLLAPRAGVTVKSVALPEPGAVPETVHERVDDSIVATRRVRVREKAGLRVVARRRPQSDELVWQVLLDRGLDADDEEVRQVSEQAVKVLQGELGAAPVRPQQ